MQLTPRSPPRAVGTGLAPAGRAGAPAAAFRFFLLRRLCRCLQAPGRTGEAAVWKGWLPCVHTLHHTWESLSADVSKFLRSCVTIATPGTRKPRRRAPVGTQDPCRAHHPTPHGTRPGDCAPLGIWDPPSGPPVPLPGHAAEREPRS